MAGADEPAFWTDSHCHVQDESGLDALLERASAAGVGRAVVVGTDLSTSRRAVEVVRAAAVAPETAVELWSTVGIHPHDAKNGVDSIRDLLTELAGAPGGLVSSRVVAVGECGLDYHYDHSPREVQRSAFAAQIGLAHEFGVALVIHTRSAWDDTLAILDSEGVPGRTVFHCFSGGAGEAAACLERGTYLSFSGIVTFPKAVELHEAAVLCPLGSMLVETDSPFLAPVPHRGQRNEPALVSFVGERIAVLKGVGAEEVASATSSNAASVFGLDTAG